MTTKTEAAKLYEMVLSAPGMNEDIKITLKLSRRNILFLGKIIERGLMVEETDIKSFPILDIITKEIKQDLENIQADILQKASLTSLHEKLQDF